jgi:cardiolipin synthase
LACVQREIELHRYNLLVGSEAFARAFEADVSTARRRVLVQAMTFEGDKSGRRVAGAITASPAEDRRVLVDSYTRHVVSDAFVWSPRRLLDRAFADEVRTTAKMFKGLGACGVGVRVTNPPGPLFLGFAARNHKKLVVADGVAYVGGLNFSDHNFAWRDLMLRIEDPFVAQQLTDDFDATWRGRPRPWEADFGDLSLYGLDGRNNGEVFAGVMARIAAARRSIQVVSPYLTFPFVEVLAGARARGVDVQLITPRANNKRVVRDYLVSAALEAGFDVRLTAEMEHLKGMLIDDEALILGSSNFDFVSYHAQEELVAVVSDPQVIADFRRMVIEPSLAEAEPARRGAITPAAGASAARALRIAERFVMATRGARRRVVPW